MEFLFIMILEFGNGFALSDAKKYFSFELSRYATIDACEKARTEIQNEIEQGNYFVKTSDGYDLNNITALYYACTPAPKK